MSKAEFPDMAVVTYFQNEKKKKKTWQSEVGIYERKILREKVGKHAFNQKK